MAFSDSVLSDSVFSDYDYEFPSLTKDNTKFTFSKILQKPKKIINKIDENDFIYSFRRNYDELWGASSLVTTTTEIKSKNRNTRYFNGSLVNIDPRLVSAVIGKRGSIHKDIVSKYNLQYFHVSEPKKTLLKSGIKKNLCKIVLTSYNRDNLMAAIRNIIALLREEQTRYIDVDYMNTN